MRIVEGVAAIGVTDTQSAATEFKDVDSFVDRLSEIGMETGCAVQAFDARFITGRQHLESAVEHANRSVARGENVAGDRSIEILCYAAGTRQIEEAMAIGVSEGLTDVGVVVDEGRIGVPEAQEPLGGTGDEAAAVTAVRRLLGPADTLGKSDEEAVRDAFEITDAEREATHASLQALVRERVALLDVEK